MKSRWNAVVSHFHNGLSKRESVVLSVLLHMVAGIAVAALTVPGPHSLPLEDPAIEFEIVTPGNLEDRLVEPTRSDVVQKAAQAVEKAGASLGAKNWASKQLVSERARIDNRSVVMASLSELDALRESFRLVTQEVFADSLGAFVPIEGKTPSTEIFSAGNGKGLGHRSGIISITAGGNGSCPPGGILK